MVAHAHAHAHAPTVGSRAFVLGMALNLLFILAEAGFGIRAHSLALLSDAGHNLSDVLGLGLAWGALVLSRRPPTERRTYGMRRASILAALANAVLLLVAVGGIAWEAVQRLLQPHAVSGGTVMIVAGLGFVINGVTAWLFRSGPRADLNLRGAYLHMAADAAVSLGVVVAGLLIVRTGWLWLDPAVSLVIAIVIVAGTWGLLREALDLALDAVPHSIDRPEVEACLGALPEVVAVHDLHIWAMSTTEIALTAHLVTADAQADDALLQRINRELRDRFGIAHTTIQLERGDGPCDQAPGHLV
jgi:cobalt-zinc-cadmium efflux system protein